MGRGLSKGLLVAPLALALGACGNGTVHRGGGSASSSSGGSSSSSSGSTGCTGCSTDGGLTGCNGCSGNTPYCDPQGRCVACSADAQCAAEDLDAGTGTSFCVTSDPANVNYGTCVQCLTTAQCAAQGGGQCYPPTGSCDQSQNCIDGGAGFCADGGAGPICDLASGECVECEQDADCADAGGLPYCDTGSKTCVACLTPAECPVLIPGCFMGACGSCGNSSDCPPGQSCDPSSNTCLCAGAVPCGCTSAGDCKAAGLGNVCLDGGGGPTCVGCLQDSDCTANDPGPFCLDGNCVQCESFSQCPATELGCDSTTNTCGTCTFNADCPPGDGCQMDSMVPNCAGICGLAGAPTDGGCVQCAGDSDCGDAGIGLCDLDSGVCQ
ncbi:MAG: hypothetical protein ACYDCL_10385 [Myxococcales bacterium]